ncbi:hypothetical protein IHQ56_10340 [Methylobacillus flagellatus]|uniref:hypothetical protein n=1 Tax=Methylobacillus flagellatus TaxID=405 RepID=UPI002853A466|nr:hypothetical protein [Methylobacillus flagellatus]MDR5172217.1 hypothetical protein [Methylobacillus flagellatus]
MAYARPAAEFVADTIALWSRRYLTADWSAVSLMADRIHAPGAMSLSCRRIQSLFSIRSLRKCSNFAYFSAFSIFIIVTNAVVKRFFAYFVFFASEQLIRSRNEEYQSYSPPGVCLCCKNPMM